MKGALKECVLKDVKNPGARAPESVREAAERRTAERWTLGEAAAELSAQSSGVMSPHDWIAILEKLVPAEVLQSPGGEMQADKVNALLEADPRWRSSTPRLPSAKQTNEHMVGFWDYSMHAADWFDMAAVTPREAASLLCQSDPLNDKANPENNTNDETGPDDFRLLLRVFSDVAQSAPKDRTLIEWFTIAEARRYKHHSWIDQYIEARARFGFPVVPTNAGGPVQNQDGKPAPEVESETTDQRCARLLQWFEEEERIQKFGALARVARRDGRARQTVTADIQRARKQRSKASNSIASMARKITN